MPGAIVINPLVRDDERAAFAVAANEGVRLLMEDTGYKPVNKPTSAQRKLLSRTAYKNDADAMAKTVFARIATMDGDMDPTPEQIEEVATMLEGFAELFEYGGKDWALLVRLANAVRRKAAVDSSNLLRPAADEAPGAEPPVTTSARPPGDYATGMLDVPVA